MRTRYAWRRSGCHTRENRRHGLELAIRKIETEIGSLPSESPEGPKAASNKFLHRFHKFPSEAVVTARSLFQWAIAVIPTHFVRTAVGTVISFHFPGLKTYSLNAFVPAASRIEEPIDLMIVILLTLPVLRSRSSRYSPFPRRSRVQVRGSPDHD